MTNQIGAVFRFAKDGACACGKPGPGQDQACSDELDEGPGGEPCRCSCHQAIRLSGHQPHFCPSASYFSKMLACDLFVFNDLATFDRGDFVQRNRILGPAGTPVYFGVPVQAGGGEVREVRIDNTKPWQAKIRGLFASYPRKARGRVRGLVELIDSRTWPHLWELSLATVDWLRDWFGVSTRCVLLSEALPSQLSKLPPVERIRALLDLYGAHTYLLGPQAHRYLPSEPPELAGQELRVLEYTEHQHEQRFADGWHPNLSAVSYVLNDFKTLPAVASRRF